MIDGQKKDAAHKINCRLYRTRGEWNRIGFKTRGTLQGPLTLEFALNYAADLRQSVREDGLPVFGPLLVVVHGDGYNVIEFLKGPTHFQNNSLFNLEKRASQQPK